VQGDTRAAQGDACEPQGDGLRAKATRNPLDTVTRVTHAPAEPASSVAPAPRADGRNRGYPPPLGR
jgi:hypothetical protein